jgi:EAL domain-containing protein (putative c-di-GMP-specific phosphodiesterase class I)
MTPAIELLEAVSAAGLQTAFDQAVLRRACEDLSMLIRQGQLPAETYVSVNIGFDDLSGWPLDEAVAAALHDTGLAPGNLVIEVTESSMMSDMEGSVEVLRRLSALGVRTAVDDFGTGYSSLAYLHRLPLDILKIDRSFVADLSGDRGPHVIIDSILALATALGLDTIAEGVETMEQAQMLKAMGCPRAQGFLWSRPVAAGALRPRLSPGQRP